jgi:hypothetical protein
MGIGAVLGDDVPVGEVVKLNVPLPSGPVTISATVRQRSSFFRYGFEFVESNLVREIPQSACRQLAVQQSAPGLTLTVSRTSYRSYSARPNANGIFIVVALSHNLFTVLPAQILRRRDTLYFRSKPRRPAVVLSNP